LTADDNVQLVVKGTEQTPPGFYLIDPMLEEEIDDSPYSFYIQKKTDALIIDLDKDRKLGDYLYDLGVVYRVINKSTGLIDILSYDDIDAPVDTIEVVY
jgi:hypothetical protein